MSDPVLVREDGSYLYTLPSVVDDIDLGITHVIRGEDHVSNTGTQIEIFEALGGTVPVFAHHNLLTGAEGEGLSKRLGSLSLAELRDEGYEPLAVAHHGRASPAPACRSSPIPTSTRMAERARSLDDLARPGALRSGRTRQPQRPHPACHALCRRRGRGSSRSGLDDEALWLAAARKSRPLRRHRRAGATLVTRPGRRRSSPTRIAISSRCAADLLPPEPWDETHLGDWTDALKAATGRKGKALFMPLRLALTGRHDGPELKSLLPLLGRKACLDRLS